MKAFVIMMLKRCLLAYVVYLALLTGIHLEQVQANIIEQECSLPRLPWIDDPSIPLCPTEGSTMLPETAPAMGYVVPFTPEFGLRPLTQFVLNTLKASESRIPILFIPGATPSAIESLKKEIRNATDPGTPFHRYRREWLSSLVALQNNSYLWQQDWMAATFDRSHGTPVLREIRQYKEKAFLDIHTLISQMGCSLIQAGDPLPPLSEKEKLRDAGVAAGGNFQGLPGGGCMYGKLQDYDTFVKYYCGENKKYALPVDSTWLHVGHVDEMVSLVRDTTQAPPCNTAVVVASPREAIRLMKSTPNLHFFDFTDTHHSERSEAEKVVCTIVRTHQKGLNSPSSPQPADSPDPDNSTAGKAAWMKRDWNWLESLGFFRPALANGSVDDENENENEPSCDPLTLTHKDFIEALEDQKENRIGDYNALIQKTMDQFEKDLLEKLTQLTGCNKINVIHAPLLFYGGTPVERWPREMITVDGKKRRFDSLTEEEKLRLPLDERYQGLPAGMAKPLLPNPVNLVNVENTAILSQPQNQAFEAYLRSQLKQIGIHVRTVDTWESSHKLRGGIHCNTHKIPICRPHPLQEINGAANESQ